MLTADAVEPTMQDAMLAALAARPLAHACFDDAERALLAYADTLTLSPAAITSDDVQHLRAAGFNNRAIHDACATVAYFAFVNRVADGLGGQARRTLALTPRPSKPKDEPT